MLRGSGLVGVVVSVGGVVFVADVGGVVFVKIVIVIHIE